ncbi:hypothetical protein ACFE04_019590 [Oxalis oulophora]
MGRRGSAKQRAAPLCTFAEADPSGISKKGREQLTEGGCRNEGGGKLPAMEIMKKKFMDEVIGVTNGYGSGNRRKSGTGTSSENNVGDRVRTFCRLRPLSVWNPIQGASAQWLSLIEVAGTRVTGFKDEGVEWMLKWMKDASRQFFFLLCPIEKELTKKKRKSSLITISRLVVVVVGIPTRPPECLLGSGRSHAADRRAVGLLPSEGSLRY